MRAAATFASRALLLPGDRPAQLACGGLQQCVRLAALLSDSALTTGSCPNSSQNKQVYRYLRNGSKTTNIAYPTVAYEMVPTNKHSMPYRYLESSSKK